MAREKITKTPQEIARLTGMSVPSYYDLESYDDEIYRTITLAELRELCTTLNIQARDLFVEKMQQPAEAVSFGALAEKLSKYLIAYTVSQAAFEAKVGWSLGAFLANPDVAWEWNVDCLRDVCAPLQVDWLDALPS